MNRRDLMKWFGGAVAAAAMPELLAKDLLLENLRQRTIILPATKRLFIPGPGELVFRDAAGRVVASVPMMALAPARNGSIDATGNGCITSTAKAVSADLYADLDGVTERWATLSVGPQEGADIRLKDADLKTGDFLILEPMTLTAPHAMYDAVLNKAFGK